MIVGWRGGRGVVDVPCVKNNEFSIFNTVFPVSLKSIWEFLDIIMENLYVPAVGAMKSASYLDDEYSELVSSVKLAGNDFRIRFKYTGATI